MAKPKRYKCRVKAEGCHGTFIKFNSFKTVCDNPKCAIEKAVKDREKLEDKKAKAERKKTRQQKRDSLTITDLLNEAQTPCNKFIRLRDKDEPCISCGKHVSGKYDAGHYITRASRPELRFHPMNIHKQCSWDCNKNKSGNTIEYRKRLIEKIGEDNVKYLEYHHSSYRYTREDVEEIKQHFKELIKEVE